MRATEGSDPVSWTLTRQMIADLRSLPFEERAKLARMIGITPACCRRCGCDIGSPSCHPVDAIAACEGGTPCPSEVTRRDAALIAEHEGTGHSSLNRDCPSCLAFEQRRLGARHRYGMPVSNRFGSVDYGPPY
jgi:hypothetical protein